MTEREYEYHNTVSLIACALLLFSGMFLIFGLLVAFLPLLTNKLGQPAGEIVYQTVYACVYAGVFLLPVVFFNSLRNRARAPEPIVLKPQMGRETWLYLFAGLAIIHAAAMLNAEIMSLFDGTGGASGGFGPVSSTNEQLILQFIVLAVVPPFVEELLFRGMVLSNLLPFGKTQAVLGSALLFGVMHQNFAQLLYATVAGLVLGYIYVATRSIWPCVTLHFANNALSVIQTAFAERLPYETVMSIYTILQVVIYGVGLLCALLLIVQKKETRAADLATNCPPMSAEPIEEIAPARRARLFFSPAMIAFFVIALLQASLSLLLNALL